MKCNRKMLVWLAAFAMLGGAGAVQAQTVDGVKNIKINEDRDQKWMVTKVYELKYIRQDDITPWILGAVQRYNAQSSVQRNNYKAGGKHFLIVTTGKDMMPYVDQMVAALDRPSAKKDEANSIVDGTGITLMSYRPKYRGNDDMITNVIQDTRSDGMGWYEANNNLFYWKDSKSHAELELKWLKAIDRPVPQVEVKLNVYEITDSDFRELGIDWIQWKNGPGATLFGAGYDISKWQGTSEAVNQALGSSSGFMFAPQFDSTFIKMLQEKGKGKSATSGALSVMNDYNESPASFDAAKYKISYTPSYEGIQKDSNRNLSVTSNTKSSFQLYLLQPTLCFGPAGDKAGFLRAGYNLQVSEAVDDVNANGDNVVYNVQSFVTYTNLNAGTEKILASYTKDQKVNQNFGMPYLRDIPVLKYVFGSSSESLYKTRVFVTVSAAPLADGSNYSKWAGDIVEAASLPEVK